MDTLLAGLVLLVWLALMVSTVFLLVILARLVLTDYTGYTRVKTDTNKERTNNE